jgi:hypothetical protein
MKKKYFILIAFSAALTLFTVSCDDYLDVMPDNRAELNTSEKVASFLVSAYATHTHAVITEMSSDNTDYKTTPTTLSYQYKSQEEAYYWEDTKDETGNDSHKDFWESAYTAIAAANVALQTIEEAGNPESMRASRGEALILRAYYHFLLVNVFALHYSDKTSENDLGLPYADEPETTVNPLYKRISVADFYKKIEADLLEGLPLIDDNAYTVAPKYHFNKKATAAFAARFYLYYRKYDKVIQYATEALGESPQKSLRNMSVFPSLSSDVQVRAREYCSPGSDAVFFVSPLVSGMSYVFANYSTGKKYQHGLFVALNETTRSRGPWNTSGYLAADWYLPSSSYTSSGYVIIPKIAYDFETTDIINATGYVHATYAVFYGDETLLCRAEAYILTEQYDKAVDDLALWMKSHTQNKPALTRDAINSFYGNLDYYTPSKPTPIKPLHPDFDIKSKEQENFIQCVLHFRRIETLHEGLRWFDVKRYGIKIYRREINMSNNDTFEAVTDSLEVDDPRRAIQLPADVIDAGLERNPRNK